MPVTSYSRTPASNNAAPPNGAPEGWAPSSVNDTIRQIMADIVNEAGKGSARVLASVAGTNTITATMSPDLDAYAAGMMVVLTPANTNTGTVTLNVDSLGALDVQKFGSVGLAAGDLVANVPAVLVLDSGADDWILLNPIASTAKYADTTANFTGTLQYGGVEVGYRDHPIVGISGNHTVVDSNRGKVIYYTGTGGHTVTFPAGLTTNGLYTIINFGTGNLTIAESGGGVLFWANGSGTISSGSRTLAVAGKCTVWQIDTDPNFEVCGTGLS